jgi:hypothetical protein
LFVPFFCEEQTTCWVQLVPVRPMNDQILRLFNNSNPLGEGLREASMERSVMDPIPPPSVGFVCSSFLRGTNEYPPLFPPVLTPGRTVRLALEQRREPLPGLPPARILLWHALLAEGGCILGNNWRDNIKQVIRFSPPFFTDPIGSCLWQHGKEPEMNSQDFPHKMVGVIFTLILVTGCGAPTAPPVPGNSPAPIASPTATRAPTLTPTPTPIPGLIWPENGVFLGAWVGPPDSQEKYSQRFEAFEEKLGRELDIIHTYFGFYFRQRTDPLEQVIMEEFPPPLVRHYLPENRIFLFSIDLRAWDINSGVGRPDVLTLQRIIKGDFDSMLRDWAKESKAFAYPLIFRFAWEMNIEWTPWGGPGNFGPEGGQPWYEVKDLYGQYGDLQEADGPERFRDAVNHAMDIFEAEGADNVYWAFGPNWITNPQDPWNNLESYWVERWDLLAPTVCAYLDDWRSFQQMYEFEVAPFLANHPRPVVIAEWSVPEDSRKAQHYWDAFAYIQARPEIKGMVVFAEDVWHPESNPASWEAFVEITNSDYFMP